MTPKIETPLEDQVLQPGKRKFRRVKEPTFYCSDFGVFLRERFEGLTVGQVAAKLDVPEEMLERWLNGTWHPDKQTRKKLGLEVVYAIRGELKE